MSAISRSAAFLVAALAPVSGSARGGTPGASDRDPGGEAGGIPPAGRLLHLEANLPEGSPLHGQCERAARVALSSPGERGALEILEPRQGAVLPRDLAAPELLWRDRTAGVVVWLVAVELPGGGGRIFVLSGAPRWVPGAAAWSGVRRCAAGKRVGIRVQGLDASLERVLSSRRVEIDISTDPVGAAILYREVPLPFSFASRNVQLLRWRLGDVSSAAPPRVVLEGLPACGNCHSFSAGGSTLGIEVDWGGDKGGYAIAPVGEETFLGLRRRLSWSAFGAASGRPREPTLGLLARLSPGGCHAVATVRDRSVLVAQDDLAFSQLFFPVQGILAVYSRDTGRIEALPGADDERYVHAGPAWSPDGRWIAFSRAPAAGGRRAGGRAALELAPGEVRRVLQERGAFRYDLYRVPFNGGRGGEAVAIAGAAMNGRSNFFPRYSPDGRWIVFCQAAGFFFLQPDSELYLVPAAGGEARRLECNLSPMSSWHSFAPNGRWLVFASKARGPYTQLYLAHIDGAGRASPPVWLSRFGAPERAANLPEFVPAGASILRRIEPCAEGWAEF